MSFDDLQGASSLNDRPATEPVDIALDVQFVGSLMEENGEAPVDDVELSALLARLDSADTVASGVEAKLDGILGTLDRLLTSLEPTHSDRPQESSESPAPSEQS